jgi:hypothetical protein
VDRPLVSNSRRGGRSSFRNDRRRRKVLYIVLSRNGFSFVARLG